MISEALEEPMIAKYVLEEVREIIKIGPNTPPYHALDWRIVDVTADSLPAIVRDVFRLFY